MTQLNVERIKLFSTRSPYWTLGAAILASLAFALLFSLIEQGRGAITMTVLYGVTLSQAIFMVLAALAVTTEYRFGTIRTSFLAVPHRTTVLLAKTLLLALLGGVVGLVCGFGAFLLGSALAEQPPLPLELEGEVWRIVAGHGALFAISAVMAVAVGVLLRQSAGAISLILIWMLLVEALFPAIPSVGPKVGPWLPFAAGSRFVADTRELPSMFGEPVSAADFAPANAPTPIQGLLVFLAYAVVLWFVALVVLRRRDA